MKNCGKLFITLALISSMAFGVTSCTRGGGPAGGPGPIEQPGMQEQQGAQQQTQAGQQTGDEATQEQKTGGAAGTSKQQGVSTVEKQIKGMKTGGAASTKGQKEKQVRGYW